MYSAVSKSHPLALDIERFYGQRKLLAQRVPIVQSFPPPNGSSIEVPSRGQAQILSRARAFSDPLSMPSGTGASTPFDSETEFDTELESQHTFASEGSGPTRLSDHDLRNRYFRRDTIVLFHFDVLRYVSFARDKDSRVIIPSFNRAQDFMLLLAIAYPLSTAVLPTHLLTSAGLHFGHALTWTVFHTLCLGLVLRAQSTRKFLVRHFLKHYHYPVGDVSRGAIREAFSSWKGVYNLSMCMSYGTCALFVAVLMVS